MSRSNHFAIRQGELDNSIERVGPDEGSRTPSQVDTMACGFVVGTMACVCVVGTMLGSDPFNQLEWQLLLYGRVLRCCARINGPAFASAKHPQQRGKQANESGEL